MLSSRVVAKLKMMKSLIGYLHAGTAAGIDAAAMALAGGRAAACRAPPGQVAGDDATVDYER